jgi:hypothetical protein
MRLFRGTWGKRSLISPEEEEISDTDDGILPLLGKEKSESEDEDFR